MLELHSNGERVGQVYAMHLDGDSSPQGHRYQLSDDVQAARRLDIYTELAAKSLMIGSACTLVEGEKSLALVIREAFDLRDHVLIKATPHR